MVQAKGVLPKGDDREILYKNPKTCGYFVGVRLTSSLTTEQLQQWLASTSTAIDGLVGREPAKAGEAKGAKVASVAAGFSSRFFERLEALQTSAPERPIGLRAELAPPNGWFGEVPTLDADVMFYVASVYETRVNEFLALVTASPVVEAVKFERGYQTSDETEPFGYKDGVHNIRRAERSRVVFVRTDGEQADEPAWTEGGTYMVTMKIVQDRQAFASLPDDAARDAVIGRTKEGFRLDLKEQRVDPHEEPSEAPDGLPPSAHVRKAGPRGKHDDTLIFRRGLPFMEVSLDKVQVGLHFCSFQANPAQFDVVFNDWMLNQQFPQMADGTPAGPDSLLRGSGPAGPFTQMVHAGLFFVPPHQPEGLVAVLTAPVRKGRPTKGRLVVSKSVVDPNDSSKRFERGGLTFHIQHQDGSPVSGAEFETASSGRGVCPVELDLGVTYRIVETATPGLAVNAMIQQEFQMNKPNEHLALLNSVQLGVYGAR